MGSDFTNFPAGCHGPMLLRGLFRGRTSQAQSDDRPEPDERAQDFQILSSIACIAHVLNHLPSHAHGTSVALSCDPLQSVARRE